jgi:lysosomal acid phosphatase
MKKIKGGALVTEIVNLMMKKRSENLNQSIFIYSGHDLTLFNLFRALKIVDQTAELPEYAATFVFEMHHSNLYPNDFEVKV